MLKNNAIKSLAKTEAEKEAGRIEAKEKVKAAEEAKKGETAAKKN